MFEVSHDFEIILQNEHKNKLIIISCNKMDFNVALYLLSGTHSGSSRQMESDRRRDLGENYRV